MNSAAAPSVAQLQQAFARCVLFGDAAIAPWIVPAGLAPFRRMQIYRHIVENILADALATSFPAVRALVGAAFFSRAADRYLRDDPPTAGNLQQYGAGFPDFLARMEETEAMPYLADVARLEWARQLSWLADEARPLSQREAAERLRLLDTTPLRLRLHPSVQLVCSDYPVFDIWRYCDDPQGEPPRADAGGQSLLLWREAAQIVMQPITAGDGAFLRRALAGASLQQAWEQTRAAGFSDYDLSALLPLLLSRRLVVDLCAG